MDWEIWAIAFVVDALLIAFAYWGVRWAARLAATLAVGTVWFILFALFGDSVDDGDPDRRASSDRIPPTSPRTS